MMIEAGIEDLIRDIKSKKDINESKSLCLVVSTLYQDNPLLLIQQYIISIIEKDYNKSIELFLNIYTKGQCKDFILYNILILLLNDLDGIEIYNICKLNFKREFNDMYNSNGESLESIIKRLVHSQSQLEKDNFKEILDKSKDFHPIRYLLELKTKESIDRYMELIEFTCQHLNQSKYYQYSLLLYLNSKKYFDKDNIIIDSYKDYWFSSIETVSNWKQKFNLPDNNELYLLAINRISLPMVFSIGKDDFTGRIKEPHLKKNDLIKLSWKYYISNSSDISFGFIVEIQDFLQAFADSRQNDNKKRKKRKKRFVIDITSSGSNVEQVRNDYFDINSSSNEDGDEDEDKEMKENDEEVEDEDSYEFQMHLGIYLLSSLFFICSWRYFKFLVTGSSDIHPSTTSFSNYTQAGKVDPIPQNLDDFAIDKENIISSSLLGSNQRKNTYMITHQVLFYANVEDESNFNDECSSIPKSNEQKEALRYLTLCMDCYNDLNQEPWLEDFKEIFSNIWNENPNFYWILNTLADGNYYYESYSTALQFYKDTKTRLSNYQSQTLLPIFENKKLLFNPKEDLYINRLFLSIGMTNHAEIEESIVYLLDILLSTPIPDRLTPSKHTYQTLKPYFTPCTEEEILFWAINSLATCYERLGMVGEMIVLYQSYWEFYNPRFNNIVNLIKENNQQPSTQKQKHTSIYELIPLSNLSKKDLQKGFFFPRFFEYIVNLDMLEEFCFLLNSDIKLDILKTTQMTLTNKQLVRVIIDHISNISRKQSLSLGFILNKFFQEELDHFEVKRESNKMQEE